MALRSVVLASCHCLTEVTSYLHYCEKFQESGITEPISGGEVRDKQDQYKGMGIEKVFV